MGRQDEDIQNMLAFQAGDEEAFHRLFERYRAPIVNYLYRFFWNRSLAEELSHRQDVKLLPKTDYEHLAGDIKRGYALLVREWLDHMRHLKRHYPYLFSLAMRTNPFDAQAKVEVG